MTRPVGFPTRLVGAVTIGTLFAGASTKIWYPCQPPTDGPISTCVALTKAVTHPRDLISNVQGSLVHFLTYLAIGTFITFALFSLVGRHRMLRRT